MNSIIEHLLYFFTPTITGWLEKEGHDTFKTWHARYFVLDASRKKITYFSDQTKSDQKGAYTFTPASIVDSSTANSTHPNLFVLTGRSLKGEAKSELFMDATSLEIKNKWIAHIRKAIKGESFLMENAMDTTSTAFRKVEHEFKAEMGLENRADGEGTCQCLVDMMPADCSTDNCTIC